MVHKPCRAKLKHSMRVESSHASRCQFDESKKEINLTTQTPLNMAIFCVNRHNCLSVCGWVGGGVRGHHKNWNVIDIFAASSIFLGQILLLSILCKKKNKLCSKTCGRELEKEKEVLTLKLNEGVFLNLKSQCEKELIGSYSTIQKKFIPNPQQQQEEKVKRLPLPVGYRRR